MIGSRGEMTRHRKSFLVCQFLLILVAGEECGNASNSRCARGVVPTRHCMRADLANSNGDATAPHVVGEWEGKGSAACRQAEGLDVLPAPVSHRRAAKCSPSQIHPSDRSERTGFRSTEVRVEGKRRRTALTRRARSPLAPLPGTALARVQR